MRKGKLIMSLALLALIVGFAISATPIVQAADGPIFIEEMVEMRARALSFRCMVFGWGVIAVTLAMFTVSFLL